MNITITFRHMLATDAVKAHAHQKVAKLQKFLRQPMTAQVTLSVEGLDHIAEARISAGGTHFQGRERSADMYSSVDTLLDKLERQINTAKGTVVARKRGGPSTREFAEASERVVATARESSES
jgi:putative sigma-54 modulation protein